MTEILDPDDDMDLDSLLADSLDAIAKKKAPKGKTKEGQPSMPQLRFNGKDKSDYERRCENAALKALWKPRAAVAMFSVQICLQCGSSHRHFEGFFVQQKHDSHRQTERWVPAKDHTDLLNLPKHLKIVTHEADACMDCVVREGYLQPSPTQTEPTCDSWTPHQDYSRYSDQHNPPGRFGS